MACKSETLAEQQNKLALAVPNRGILAAQKQNHQKSDLLSVIDARVFTSTMRGPL